MDRRKRLKEARDKTLDFLLRHIEENGCWRDFEIPEPGISDEWVTANVGHSIIDASVEPTERVKSALKTAADFLSARKRANRGWGYNAKCRIDCDSTANAFYFLRRMSVPVDLDTVKVLLSFQNSDGGFGTFHPMKEGHLDSWSISHPDVTAMVLFALQKIQFPSPLAIVNGLAYLQRVVSSQNLPLAFWWNSRFYTLHVICRVYQAYGIVFEAPKIETGVDMSCLDKALLLEILCLSGKFKKIEMVENWLLEMQMNDGSFIDNEILRVLNPDCFCPSENNGEMAFAPVNRVFSSAAALKALSVAGRYER